MVIFGPTFSVLSESTSVEESPFLALSPTTAYTLGNSPLDIAMSDPVYVDVSTP